jgi:hypothetical protein
VAGIAKFLEKNSVWWVYKFMENYAIMPSLKGIGFKNKNSGRFFSSQEVAKTVFDCAGQGCCIISA